MFEFINKEDLILRQLLVEDKKSFLKWHNDTELRNYIGGAFPFAEETFLNIIKQEPTDNPSNVWFGVCQSEKLIGIAGLHNIKYIQNNAEISFFVGDKKFRGKGYGAAIVDLLKHYAFETIGLHRVYARIYSGNLRSIRTLEKCGFMKEGVLHEANYWNGNYRDINIYAIINSGTIKNM